MPQRPPRIARFRTLDDKPALARAIEGAITGGAFAGICLVIGAIRVGWALLSGAGLSDLSRQDALILPTYMGGFVLAGAMLGVMAPMRRSKAGALVMGLVGAGVAFSAFGFGIASDLPRQERWALAFSIPLCTVIFGVMLARHLYAPRPPAA